MRIDWQSAWCLSLQTGDWALATKDRPRHLKLESQGRSGVLEIVRSYYKKRSVLGGTVAVVAVVMWVRSRKVERVEDTRRDYLKFSCMPLPDAPPS